MGRPYKDSKQGTILRVVKREDGTFDLFLNRSLDRERLDERSMPDQLCVCFGYCGEEYTRILEELNRSGDPLRWEHEFNLALQAVREKLWDPATQRYWDLDVKTGKLWTPGPKPKRLLFPLFRNAPRSHCGNDAAAQQPRQV